MISDFIKSSAELPVVGENSLLMSKGYTFCCSVYNKFYEDWGYLYKNELGEVERWEQKRVTFTEGAAVGVVIGVIAVFIVGPITSTAILIAMGTGVVGGVISSTIDSNVCYAHYKNLYQGYCNDELTLEEYQLLKYSIVYDYINQEETELYYGVDGGYNGTESDMANSAVVRYYN